MNSAKVVPSLAAFQDLIEQENANYWKMAALSYVSAKLPSAEMDSLVSPENGPSAEQVRKLADAWKWAVSKGHALDIEPGDTADLPSVEFPTRYK